MAPAKQKKPLIAENAKDLATLKVLQKTDPSVVEILGSASHVTLYGFDLDQHCLLYTSPSPRDATLSRMPSSA